MRYASTTRARRGGDRCRATSPGWRTAADTSPSSTLAGRHELIHAAGCALELQANARGEGVVGRKPLAVVHVPSPPRAANAVNSFRLMSTCPRGPAGAVVPIGAGRRHGDADAPFGRWGRFDPLVEGPARQRARRGGGYVPNGSGTPRPARPEPARRPPPQKRACPLIERAGVPVEARLRRKARTARIPALNLVPAPLLRGAAAGGPAW